MFELLPNKKKKQQLTLIYLYISFIHVIYTYVNLISKQIYSYQIRKEQFTLCIETNMRTFSGIYVDFTWHYRGIGKFRNSDYPIFKRGKNILFTMCNSLFVDSANHHFSVEYKVAQIAIREKVKNCVKLCKHTCSHPYLHGANNTGYYYYYWCHESRVCTIINPNP